MISHKTKVTSSKRMMKFAVVEFMEGMNEIGIIPSSWILREGICCYPSSLSTITEKLIRYHATPSVDWKKYKIKILKKYETYCEARKNLIKAEETSSLDSEPEESSKRKKRPPKRLISEEDSDDNTSKIKITEVSSYSSLESFNNIPENSNIEPSQPMASTSFNHITVPVHPTTPNNSEVDFNKIALMLGQLQKTVSNLVNEVRELKEEVRAGRLIASIKEEEQDVFSCQMDLTGKLPLQTLDDFFDNEESLKDTKFRNLLVKILVSSGGRNSRHFTYNVLKRLMSNQLATNFSFTGKPAKDKGKERKLPFCSTLMYKSIQDAARKMFPGTTEDALKQNVSLWLQQAKHRMSNRDSSKNAEPNEMEWILS